MSYTNNPTLIPDNSTTTNFRAWGSTVSAAISSMGLIQTSDTSQINWTTVAIPGAANTSQGYEMWRFNDTLQSTVPVFIKIEYGSSVSTTYPGLWITIGTGTNGTGTLTGKISARIQVGTGSNNTTTAYTCAFSGDINRVGIALFANYSSNQAFFIERTKNTDGTDSSLGVLMTAFSYVNNRVMQFVPFTGTVPATILESNIYPPVGATTSGTVGADLAVYPNFLTRGGAYLNSGLTHFGYFNADITRDITFTMTFYNATHIFYPLGNTSYFGTVGRGGISNICLAMRYE